MTLLQYLGHSENPNNDDDDDDDTTMRNWRWLEAGGFQCLQVDRVEVYIVIQYQWWL